MSILTKVFVVLVTVVSCVVMAMVVSFAQSMENYDAKYQDMKTQAATANQRYSAIQSEITRLTDEHSDALNSQAARISELNTQLSKEVQKNSTQSVDLASAKADLGKLTADIARLTSTANQISGLLSAKTEQLESTRARMADLQKQNVELVDNNNELASKNDSLTRANRQSAEAIATLNSQYSELRAVVERMAESGVTIEPGPTEGPAKAGGPAVPIIGKVVRVSEAAGEVFVELNVGSNDNVAEGYEFLVHRGNTYLGTLTIETVDVNASTGRIANPDRSKPIKGGDSARAGI